MFYEIISSCGNPHLIDLDDLSTVFFRRNDKRLSFHRKGYHDEYAIVLSSEEDFLKLRKALLEKDIPVNEQLRKLKKEVEDVSMRVKALDQDVNGRI